MSRAERDKGARGEREVADVLRSYGLACDRTPNSGGLHIAGDVTGVEGYHIEVKRQETLRLPLWLRQAESEAPEGAVPVVAFRQNRADWYATLPLRDLTRLLAEAQLAREGSR